MKMQKVYVETTLFNYYFDTDRDAHLDTVTFFEECAAGKFEPYTSDYVIEELEDAPKDKRDKMVALIEQYNITVLFASEKIVELAKKYVVEGALPQGSQTDARHIAAASVNALDKIVSLNFRHIVKTRTILMTNAINTLLGYPVITIESPMEAIDYEKTRYHLGRGPRDTPRD